MCKVQLVRLPCRAHAGPFLLARRRRLEHLSRYCERDSPRLARDALRRAADICCHRLKDDKLQHLALGTHLPQNTLTWRPTIFHGRPIEPSFPSLYCRQYRRDCGASSCLR